MRRLLALLAVLAVTGCTDRQVTAWLAWWADDPAAAETFAADSEIQAQLSQREVPSTPSRSSRWDRIAACETGNRWSLGPIRNSSGVFGGGLAIMVSPHDVWSHYGGDEFASQPWFASREQQIIIAERIAADVGIARAWQCA